ncbi:MAG: hypothetical protein A3C49_04425 [Candidatus Doudnabacteria bacterium RIFCSPHIGHO2_02_FULL_42_25]|uniref:Uncharacterized protein n=1 Tax=Candidatus Doudnabacteria bacterium RIFCSPHIGHO2_01_FULL_41_86 TaxID=1817821 RepID=A0A1F5N8Q5_9BACT|nr:MAG: hypothetical protein A2717_00565 [Candidatus Doudnabacteria bacterium RIFCSPHIGHO2_01_FULL_41_86]OGE75140.1 MAG: hypothetical protein A3K07_01485 [Candidatus Doudnabacteria bacterium RIFCSPHIGHO2_01_43_10]OGE86435.1 MAG: hypothetical protein A3E28_00440 [Candidatus Doudnabacteria bacterium RIFCSPHIGHO2_12_FULL_42_22]OGE87434.1 MAG: hypothetical protein A3C49_04425 [Candidatus Doudnabacteria bacterium RIFCSPHIGHO2_02_FULL_42_25]OGE92732.1 MAG: hypothetical protein A2895_03920 [Candidatus
MFEMFEALWENLQERARIGRLRMTEFRVWFGDQVRDVQIAVILMIANIVVFAAATRVLGSNTPARIGIFTGYLIYLYVSRKIAVPLLGVDLFIGIWRRVNEVIPNWLRNIVGQPPEVHAEVHAGSQEVLWHEKYISGIAFHLISTIFMWSEVFLMVCGIFPVWENDWFSATVMITTMILFFVATEDFVDIKKWRRRLGYAVTVYALFLLGPMTVRTIAPGTYDYLMAKYHYSQTEKRQTAKSIETKEGVDRYWRERVDKQELQLLNKQREYKLDPVGHSWTAEDEQQLEAIQEIKADLKPEEDQSSEGWISRGTNYFEEHPILLLLVGLVILAGSMKSTSHHH